MAIDRFTAPSGIRAILGPTNTGKTHFAIQRMLGYRTGCFGLPLRLLAREVYDRVVAVKSADQVALITGEEKIHPPHARYFICTTESMPRDKAFEFVAVDEVQLAAHPQRGHVFTDRILWARGRQETLFLGSDTMTSVLNRMVPKLLVEAKPRLSELNHTGYRKLTNLPPRSAVVAFSAERVVALAERLRVKYGGTAVVTGALSPRSRNAQVALYENGDVDYLVATDAIGMGLNLDVHHIALANDWKFDGLKNRPLRSDEVAQIAGRAGRFRRNGTFGTTDGLQTLDPEVVEAVCAHQFEPIRQIYWRTNQLNFHSIDGLLSSLETPPKERFYRQKRNADDHLALERLSVRGDIRELAKGRESIELLWEVCGVPDFSSALPAYHSDFLGLLFKTLREHHGVLPDEFVAERVHRLDRDDGNIETLMARIGAIRTWTFIANRGVWLDRDHHWQDVTQGIEDRISDALHERLTERFVDRRTSVLKRWVPNQGTLQADVDAHGTVRVAQEPIANLIGLDIEWVGSWTPGTDLLKSIRRGLKPLVEKKVEELLGDDNGAIQWLGPAEIGWQGGRVARLRAGQEVWSPRIHIVQSDWLDGKQRGRLHQRLQRWINDQVKTWQSRFQPEDRNSPPERAILYALESGRGWTSRGDVQESLKTLSQRGRKRLKQRGVHFGPQYLTMPVALEDSELLFALWSAQQPKPVKKKWVPVKWVDASDWPRDLLRLLGFQAVGEFRIRTDILDRILQDPKRADDVLDGDAKPILKALNPKKKRGRRGTRRPRANAS